MNNAFKIVHKIQIVYSVNFLKYVQKLAYSNTLSSSRYIVVLVVHSFIA
jgi:hypothetical protein